MKVREVGLGVGRRWAALVAAVALVSVAGSPRMAEGQALCHITSADAFFYADTTRADAVTYFAQVIAVSGSLSEALPRHEPPNVAN